MVDPRSANTGGMPPEEEAAMAALKRLPLQTAPPAVREAARRAFLQGAAGLPDASERTGGPEIAPPPRRRPGRPLLIGALAAAATLLLLLPYGAGPTEVWRIREVVGPAGVTLAGGGALEPGAPARPGAIVVGPESELELQLGSTMRIRLLPGTNLTLPAPPGRWLGRTRRLEVRSGEAFGTTAGPLGFAFQLRTPEATATLTGTSFAVIRDDSTTCFCLYRGALAIVTAAGARSVELPLEHRVLIFRDGRATLVQPINARERMKLTMIDGAGVPPLTPRP